MTPDELKQIQSRARQHIHIGGVCIRCDQLHPCQVLLADRLAALQQRVERLEGALQEIDDLASDRTNSDSVVACSAGAIARAALAGEAAECRCVGGRGMCSDCLTTLKSESAHG